MNHTSLSEVTMPIHEPKLWTPKQVAEHFHRHKNLVYAWLNAGDLGYIGPKRPAGSRKRYLIPLAEIRRLEREGLPDDPRRAA